MGNEKHVVLLCRCAVIAAAEDHEQMKCFEVMEDSLFVCFATGKMEVYSKATQARVRKPIAAHGAEIKFIAKGSSNPFLYTACADNQVSNNDAAAKSL